MSQGNERIRMHFDLRQQEQTLLAGEVAPGNPAAQYAELAAQI